MTGASGFIGRNLLLRIPRSWETFAVYNTDASFLDFCRNGSIDCNPTKCDLSNEAEARKLAKRIGPKIDLCIHLAGNTDTSLSARNPLADLKSNTDTMLNVIQNFRISKMVLMSSGAVYEGLRGRVHPGIPVSPLLPYAVSKLASERYLIYAHERSSNPEYFDILRFFGAYGPHESPRKVYSRLVKAFFLDGKSEFTLIGDGENLIDAMYIDDAVTMILKLASRGGTNSTFDFCAGNPLTLTELVRKAARDFEVKNPKIEHRGLPFEYQFFKGSPKPFERLVKFRPRVPLSEGLKKLASFLQRTNGKD